MMLWNIYDEDMNEFVNHEFHASLEEAMELLQKVSSEDTFGSREWGIRLYPANKEALVELENEEHASCIIACL